MNEAFRNLAVLVWAVCAVNNNSYASDNKMIIAEEAAAESPTIVYGASQTAPGKSDEVVVEQGANAPNPFGNPINGDDSSIEVPGTAVIPEKIMKPAPQPIGNSQTNSPAKPQGNDLGLPDSGSLVVPAEPAGELGQDFQNTLIESEGTVYDIQAFPEEDMKVIGNPENPKTIYSPNVNPY